MHLRVKISSTVQGKLSNAGLKLVLLIFLIICTQDNEQPGEERSSSKPDSQAESSVSDSSVSCTSKTLILMLITKLILMSWCIDEFNSRSVVFILDPNLTIVLSGNSASVQFGEENILLGEKLKTESTEISNIVLVSKKISKHHISMINMIDVHESERVDHLIGQLVNEHQIKAFILVVRLGQLKEADGLEWLQKAFGDKVLKFVMILFTYEREEELETVTDDPTKNPVLKQLLEKCGGRYQTCKKEMNNQSEINELMNKIEHLFNENQQQCYTGQKREAEESQKNTYESGEKKKKTFLIDISHG